MAGTIRGESVILGRSDFMAQMGVRLPREIKLPTGVFLAVDRELVAVFAIKYKASDNVDAALQAVLHNGICPVFAVRDFNITPALIKRKFKVNTKKRCLYPELSDRLAFSEEEHESSGRPAALLFREGLMPYAETVVGGKRMYGAVRKKLCLGADRQHLRHNPGVFTLLLPAAFRCFHRRRCWRSSCFGVCRRFWSTVG